MDENTVFQYDLQSGSCQSKSVAARRVVQGKTYEGSTCFTAGKGGGCDDRSPKWRDDLESVADELFANEDDSHDGSDVGESIFDPDTDPDPNNPTQVQAAIRKHEEREEAERRAKLSVHQQKALNLLERASRSTVSVKDAKRVDPVKRFAELKTHGTINGKAIVPDRRPPVKLKGGIE
jgi:hypothetical protein